MKKSIFSLLFMTTLLGSLHSGEVTCPVTKDNSIAMYNSGKINEWPENVGKKNTLKIKGNENIPIMQFDLSGIPKGSSIEGAELIVTLADPSFRIRHVGYSTIPMDWVEGENADPSVESHGFSCFTGANGVKTGWGQKNLNFADVISSNGGNVTGIALAENLGNSKFKLVLPGRVVEAMLNDQKGGLCLIDESGWWDKSKRCNIYLFSKESKENTPVLKVTYSEKKDSVLPSEPKIKQILSDEVDGGDFLIEITAGGDDGGEGQALFYDIRIIEGEAFDWDKANPIERHLIPRPLLSGKVSKHLFRHYKPGKSYVLGIKAYDEAGNFSKVAEVKISVNKIVTVQVPDLNQYTLGQGGAIVGKKIKVWAIDELSKIDPVKNGVFSGKSYSEDTQEAGNTVWDGKEKKIKLMGVKGEYVSFRLVVENISGSPVESLSIKEGVLQSASEKIDVKYFRFLRDWYLKVKDDYFSGAMPELKNKNNGFLSLPAKDNPVSGQTRQSVFSEIFIPYDIKAGTFEGNLSIEADGDLITVPVQIQVLDQTMPKELNFVIELNAYGAGNKEYFHKVHRLAHIYRTGYNALEYGHSGSESVPFVPKVEGVGKDAKVVDWSVWDAWLEPCLTGELFKDLPRGAVPIPHYYMPFYENYPMPVTEYMNNKIHSQRKNLQKGDYWFFMCENDVLIEDGFSDAWKEGLYAIGKQYRDYFEKKGWTKTQFQLFLNNKVFKGKDKATSLWTLDEPTFGRDFRALGYMYREMKKPFEGSSLNMITRGDISRPGLQGDRVDNAVDYNVVSAAFYVERDIIERRMIEKDEKYWVYGGAGRSAANYDLSHLAGVYIRYWILGAEGGLAYWTSFGGATWEENEPLAVVLKGEFGYPKEPTATGRLTATRRVQQDIELMLLLSKKEGWSRKKVTKLVNSIINLEATNESDNPDDPGNLSFNRLKTEHLFKLRRAIQDELMK